LIGDALIFREPIAHGGDSIKDFAAQFDVRRCFAQLTIALAGSQSYAATTRVVLLTNEPLQKIGVCEVRRGVAKEIGWTHIDHRLCVLSGTGGRLITPNVAIVKKDKSQKN
jgi:hypothetical protein